MELAEFGPVAGRQTVNRAEAMALLQALKGSSGAILYVTDSSYVVKGIQKLNRTVLPKSNRDLWFAIKEAAESRDIQVQKVQSHRGAEDLEEGAIPPFWFMGNEIADGVAGACADHCELPFTVTSTQDWIDSTAYLIRARAAEVLIDVVEADPSRSTSRKASRIETPKGKAKPKRKPQIETLIENSEHTVSKSRDGSYHCSKCSQTASGFALKPWLADPCRPANEVIKSGTKQAQAQVRVRRAVAHPSHSITRSEAPPLWFCMACGGFAATKMRTLSKQCPRIPTSSGKQNLERIKKNLFPGSGPAALAWNGSRAQPKRKAASRRRS